MIDRLWEWATDHEVHWLAFLCYEIVWVKDKMTGAV
jgi:hypothetical protein